MLQRQFTKRGPQVSALGSGGHHLGDAEDLPTAVRIVHEAIDGGVSFFQFEGSANFDISNLPFAGSSIRPDDKPEVDHLSSNH